MPRDKHTDEELLEYSRNHLLYEFVMFDWVAQNFPAETGYRMSATLEAFAVHLRNLIDFFYLPSEKPDDMIAEDFCDPASGWKPGDLSALLGEARTRANKEINHITYKRKNDTDPTKWWPVESLINEIHAIEKQFVNTASPKKLDGVVRQHLERPTLQTAAVVNASTQSPKPTILRS